MNISLKQSEVCLAPRQTMSLVDAAGVRIHTRSGIVWVTQDNDLRDVILREGESFTLEDKGRAIVQAFEPSRVRLSRTPAAARREAWTARFARVFKRALPGLSWA